MNRWALNIRNRFWNITLINLFHSYTVRVFKVWNYFAIFFRNSILLCQCIRIHRLYVFNWIIVILWFLIKWWWFWLILKSYLAWLYFIDFIIWVFAVILFISVFHLWNSVFNGLRVVRNTLVYRIVVLNFMVIAWRVLISISICVLQLWLSNLASTVSELLSSLFLEELFKFLLFL